MKFILLFILCIYSCSISDNGKVEATLRVTVYKSKDDPAKSLLLFTTIYHNKTGKDIYFIKSIPWSIQFLKKNNFTDFSIVQDKDLNRKVMDSVVQPWSYLSRVIYSSNTRKMIVDSIAKLNSDNIKDNYSNIADKFKSQFLVMKNDEVIEIDNSPIYDEKLGMTIYEFISKKKNDLLERRRLGEDLKIPGRIENYVFWDGEIKLDSQEIEVVFKDI